MQGSAALAARRSSDAPSRSKPSLVQRGRPETPARSGQSPIQIAEWSGSRSSRASLDNQDPHPPSVCMRQEQPPMPTIRGQPSRSCSERAVGCDCTLGWGSTRFTIQGESDGVRRNNDLLDRSPILMEQRSSNACRSQFRARMIDLARFERHESVLREYGASIDRPSRHSLPTLAAFVQLSSRSWPPRSPPGTGRSLAIHGASIPRPPLWRVLEGSQCQCGNFRPIVQQFSSTSAALFTQPGLAWTTAVVGANECCETRRIV